MEIIDINRNTLGGMAQAYPGSFEGMGLEGDYLTYAGQKVDISKFNINDLLTEENAFASNLGSLTPEDVFKIIRLHAVMLESKKMTDSKINKTEIIQKENPLLKNISIVSRVNEHGSEELINIVDSKGNDHVFENDRNVDILYLCEYIRSRKGSDVTPEELVAVMHDKLPEVMMEKAERLIEKPSTTEDFANKLRAVNEPYKNEKTVRVYGNQEHDVALVVDSSNLAKHEIVTFRKNEYGDFETQRHLQNVSGTDTSITTEAGGSEQTEVSTEEEVKQDVQFEGFIRDEKEIEIRAVLISSDEFYRLLNSPLDLSEEERKNVDLYYGYLGDLVLYEDYLVPELKDILNRYRAYVYDIQFNENDEFVPNEKQQEAVRKAEEFEEKKQKLENERSLDKVEEEVKKLTLKNPDTTSTAQAGFVATMQVIAFIVGVAIILTAVTLFLIS